MRALVMTSVVLRRVRNCRRIITAARPAYAGTEGCYVLRMFFFFFLYLTNKRKNGRTLFGAKYGRT